MILHGLSLIGGEAARATGRTFQAENPVTGEHLTPPYHEADLADVTRAGDLAAAAFPEFARTPGTTRAALLRRIANEIEELGEALLTRYTEESGLPRGRADGERARTCGQFRLFADLISTDSWADPRHDAAEPDRHPLPKPDLRSVRRPIGPVAVFGPANFPLAYAVAGGDTASALAAGCPVIVKAHPSHPGTSELVGHAVVRAVRATGLPPGIFSLLFDSGHTVGTALLKHPAIRGAGFTGSKTAGRALHELCATRPSPIPFFGELSSLNPVCLLPGALAARPEAIAEGLAASLTLGCGQFCTNPGLILHAGADADVDRWLTRLLERVRATPPAAMLNRGIRDHYEAGLSRLAATPGVETLLRSADERGPGGTLAAPALFRCDAATLRSERRLHEEVFGPATLLVTCSDVADMTATMAALEGQLTASVHQAGDDLAAAGELLFTLEQRAGRLVFDGWPTGVEVCPSMVHGGPWPATTDSRFTSVGTGAILRWVRPVCWQNAPAPAFPPALLI